MPLCRSIQDDVLMWPFNLNGVYTVKSRYRFLHEEQCRKQQGPSEVEVLKPLWNKIWGLHVLSKIKHLAWKVCKNSLPTELNLVRHKIITDGCCDVCKTLQEDVVHALFLCPDFQPLWSTMPKWNHGTLMACTSFIDIFDCIFAGNKDPDLFAAVIWTPWTRRNNLCLGKPALPLNKVIEFAQERLTEVVTSTPLPSYPTQHTAATWITPWTHSYKLNFDGARIGVVIRNEAGLIMASLSQRIPMPTSVIEVEALVARRAMELALELSFDNVILEGDFEILMKTLKTGESTLAHLSNLSADILFLTSHFSKVHFSFVRRQCNRLAHSLARCAFITQQMSVCMEELPPDLMPAFLADLHNLP